MTDSPQEEHKEETPKPPLTTSQAPQGKTGEAPVAEGAIKLKGVPPPDKKPDNIRNVRYSKVNPMRLTLAQHEEGKIRVAKITGIIFCVFFVGVFLLFAWKYLEKTWATERYLEDIRLQLKRLDELIEQSNGFERDQAALAAIAQVDNAIPFSKERELEKLKDSRQHYLRIISEGGPALGIPEGINFVVPSTLTEMMHIPAGRFDMGRRSNEPGGDVEQPRHPVLMTYEFWMARTETTNAQLRTLFPNHNVEKWGDYSLNGEYQPAVNISWHNAVLYCSLLTDKEKAAGRIPEGYVYRLPTEAEWEYACRAGTETYYYWGDSFGNTGAGFANSLDKQAASILDYYGGPDMPDSDGFIVSSPVGRFAPNAFKLCDMSGNVWEWCQDWYNPKAYRELSERAPVAMRPVTISVERRKPLSTLTYTIETTCKVIRGGSWGNLPSQCRSATRDFAPPEDINTGIGFRIVLAPALPQPKKQ